MKRRQTIKSRASLLAIAACAALGVFGASSAAAASTMQVTTDTNQVGQLAAVKIKTALTGSGTAKKQYGATFVMPEALHVSYYYFGDRSNFCDAGSFSTVSGGLNSVQAFSNANCPTAAKIGTATLGNRTGTIYAVSASPLPAIGVYFDQGGAAFGRRLNTSWTDGNMTASIMGLPNASTDGLELNFNNPGRANGLSPKVFEWTEPGTSACVKNPQVTGKTYHWPSIVWPWSTYSTTPATPATLTLNGCDFAFEIGQDATAAGAEVAPWLGTGIYNGATQYGQTFDLPASLWLNHPAWGGPTCSPTSFSIISTGLTPTAGGFTPVDCPAGSVVGTAGIGNQGGKIYLVSSSPIPQFGVYFDTNVAAPYGRRLNIDWGVEGYGRPQLRIFGLQGPAGNGLELNFNPPAAGQEKMFNLAPSGSAECANDHGRSTVYTYPTSGTAATSSGVLTSRGPLYITGC